jgi:hypothetical protein
LKKITEGDHERDSSICRHFNTRDGAQAELGHVHSTRIDLLEMAAGFSCRGDLRSTAARAAFQWQDAGDGQPSSE